MKPSNFRPALADAAGQGWSALRLRIISETLSSRYVSDAVDRWSCEPSPCLTGEVRALVPTGSEQVLGHGLNVPGNPSPPRLLVAPFTIELLASPLGAISVDSFERILWWLFAGSAGATTRAQVLQAIREQPRNAQQLSEFLSLDYTTVRHHLRVLETNRLVLAEGDKYGRVYFISDLMESHWDKLDSILKRAGRERRSGER